MKLLQGAILALPLIPGAFAQMKRPVPNAVRANAVSTTEVLLPSGTVIGIVDEVESFLGIPYADPPEVELRLRPPKKLSRPLGTFNATKRAASCPQMGAKAPASGLAQSANQASEAAAADRADVFTIGVQGLDAPEEDEDLGQEDCLTITVQRPRGTTANDKLPVFYWVFGGGFTFGATNQYDAAHLINFAERRGQKFIFVSVNYRVNGFGFLGGTEIYEEGSANIGLLDQRMGLEWVADNIASFGGDPDKVTISGESAGAISAFDQLLLFNGSATYKEKSLFRAAYLFSGSITPVDPINSPKANAIFRAVAEKAGCNSTVTNNTLSCLRGKPYKTFYDAVVSVPRIGSYSSLALSYLPRPDGRVLGASPDVLVKEGKIHAVPIIVGDQEDEGTIFALAQYNLTSTDRLVTYLANNFFSHASRDLVQAFVTTYPASSSAGSPFRTGEKYDKLYGSLAEGFFKPGFKRVAAILGDFVFTLARRLAIEDLLVSKPGTPIWSFLNSYNHEAPLVAQLGTSHATDVTKLFEGTDLPSNSTRTYLLNFLFNKDPNVGGDVGGTGRYPAWPKWVDNKDLLWFNATEIGLLPDNFRAESYNFMRNNTAALYF